MKEKVQSFGRFLSGMVMPNIGAFIAWGFLTALFIEAGWFPNERLAEMVSPMLTYVLPLLIAYTGGKMVGGDRGGVIGAIAAIGVICGSEYTMFMGAMIVGPLAGLIIKKFDKAVDGKIKAGFEMLVNNFSVGLIGLALAIIGYYLIGPFMSAILSILTSGVNMMVSAKLTPLVAVFVEPAKVLFLNNAINHGIFTPLGAEQVAEAGKSILYMIETNPGPGLGVLLGYWAVSKDKVTKNSAPGAIIVHFFGGIHEISFPYVLMNPLLLLATIAGSASALLFFTFTGVGLVGPASPGSIIAFLSMAARGDTVLAFVGVAIATAISFLIACPIIKMSDGKKNLADAQNQMKSMKAESKGQKIESAEAPVIEAAEAQQEAVDLAAIRKIVFACDAGMGSSAMGATVLKKKLTKAGITDVAVEHSSVSEIPEGIQLVVCHEDLKERARTSAKHARIITIQNFMAAPEYDQLVEEIKQARNL